MRRLCACGCGKYAGVYVERSRGHKKGEPKTFLHGHSGGDGTTHGLSRRHGKLTPEWQSYTNARQRCTNPKNTYYEDYGGRGIKFLFTNIQQFFAELGPRPEGKTLDRIDNNGNYEVGNVRWSTPTQQANNRRKHDTRV
jgi:hypothetical protein